jgi:hypothetical protein
VLESHGAIADAFRRHVECFRESTSSIEKNDNEVMKMSPFRPFGQRIFICHPLDAVNCKCLLIASEIPISRRRLAEVRNGWKGREDAAAPCFTQSSADD